MKRAKSLPASPARDAVEKTGQPQGGKGAPKPAKKKDGAEKK